MLYFVDNNLENFNNSTDKCEIPSMEHGNISKPFSEGDFVDHRERFPLECDEGFVVEMDTRCNNGSWNWSTKCVPSRSE